jgi:hypothetical protein
MTLAHPLSGDRRPDLFGSLANALSALTTLSAVHPADFAKDLSDAQLGNLLSLARRVVTEADKLRGQVEQAQHIATRERARAEDDVR